MLRDAYFPIGMVSFLGKLEWGCLGKMALGCKFFRDSIFPVTPGQCVCARLLIFDNDNSKEQGINNWSRPHRLSTRFVFKESFPSPPANHPSRMLREVALLLALLVLFADRCPSSIP